MDVRRWVIGFDFAFGNERRGNANWLRDHGFAVDVVPPFMFDGKALHSSEVRRLVTLGDMELANRLLGREYSMSGPVEAGDRVGRSLGFPTANIAIEPNKLVPALGAYAGRAKAPEGDFIAALSVGYRPTFGGTQLRVEGFLLDFEGDLYQQRLEFRFVRYLHPDIAFPTTATLRPISDCSSPGATVAGIRLPGRASPWMSAYIPRVRQPPSTFRPSLSSAKSSDWIAVSSSDANRTESSPSRVNG